MSQSLGTKLKGLYTFPSDLSEVPEGALLEASNIVIDQDSVAEPRRGFGYLAHGGGPTQSQYSDPTYRAAKLFFYQGQLLSHYGPLGSPTKLAYHDGTSGWTNYSGTFNPPSATVPMRAALANQNFYFTTSLGVQKLDSYTGTPKAIGVPPGLDLQTSVTSGTWLAAGGTAAYRVLWGIKDANQNLILGAPSQRSEITNTTGTAQAVTVTSTIPAGITTSHFYQLYRSKSVDNSGSPPATFVEPNDELGLIYEGNPNNTDLSNGYISVTDVVPDSLRGATIYTAESQEGLANENAPAPLALDLAVFRNCLFFGNTSGLQSYNLTLLGVGSPSGVQTDDTITVGGITYTGKATETAASAQFLVSPVFSLSTTATTNSNTSLTSLASTTGLAAALAAGQVITVTGTGIPSGTFITALVSTTATLSQAATASGSGVSVTITGNSAAQAIRDTALSLVKVINRYASSTVYAYYLSGPTDLPGMMLFQSRTVGAAAFPVVSSRGTCWNPALPTSGTTQSSTNDQLKNAVFYSKVSEPEAVPLANFILVGSADKNVLRIIALRDSLFILKEDGIFRLWGTDPSNFQVSPLDYTAILIAPETAAALNNQIYALTTQGVVAISETGVSIMSHPIESSLTSLVAQNLSLLQTSSFAVAYESSRAYYLWVPTEAADTGPTQYFRYNYITNTWVHAALAKICGVNSPPTVDDRLYLGNAGMDIIDVERKTLTYSDYADYASTQTISAVSGKVVTITSPDTIVVGSVIYQSATVFGTVASVDPVGGTVTMTLATAFANAAADVLAPIPCAVSWVPVTMGNPGLSKHFREVALFFLSDFNGTGTVGFSSDVNPNVANEAVSGSTVGGWGLFAWGGPQDVTPSGGPNLLGVPWGGANRRRPIRVSVPKNQRRCSLLFVSFTHAYAYSPWLLQGLSAVGDITGERIGK